MKAINKLILLICLTTITLSGCTGKKGGPGSTGAAGTSGIQGEAGPPGDSLLPAITNTPQGTSGAGSFVNDNSTFLFEKAKKELSELIQNSSDLTYVNLPSGWTKDKIAQVIFNARALPNTTRQRKVPFKECKSWEKIPGNTLFCNKDLMLDYGTDKDGPYIEILQPFFETYASHDSQLMNRKYTGVVEVQKRMLRELSHHFPSIGKDDIKARAFAISMYQSLRAEGVYCYSDKDFDFQADSPDRLGPIYEVEPIPHYYNETPRPTGKIPPKGMKSQAVWLYNSFFGSTEKIYHYVDEVDETKNIFELQHLFTIGDLFHDISMQPSRNYVEMDYTFGLYPEMDWHKFVTRKAVYNGLDFNHIESRFEGMMRTSLDFVRAPNFAFKASHFDQEINTTNYLYQSYGSAYVYVTLPESVHREELTLSLTYNIANAIEENGYSLQDILLTKDFPVTCGPFVLELFKHFNDVLPRYEKWLKEQVGSN